MPPKAKYTREEIIQTALELVSERGIEALNARNLAAALGTSTRPVFTAFRNMNELVGEVKTAAMRKFDEYAKYQSADAPDFKNIGMRMIHFAVEQPKLFLLLHTSERETTVSFDEFFTHLGETGGKCVDIIMRDYGLDRELAKTLFQSVWLYTFSIGVLIASKVCRYDEEEVSEMLSLEFQAVFTLIKSGKLTAHTDQADKKAIGHL